MRSCKYEELTARELKAALNEKSLVYFPIGSLEFHGPHLPLGMDTIHAYEFCLQAAEQTGGVALPPTVWGALGHVGYFGSLLVSEHTRDAIVRDVFRLLSEQGVKLIVATTGHWPAKQGERIGELAGEAMRGRPETQILTLDPFTANPTDKNPGHAGLNETALMMFLAPDLVHMDELREEDDFRGIGKNCVEATRDFGRAYFEASLTSFVKTVEEMWAGLPGS